MRRLYSVAALSLALCKAASADVAIIGNPALPIDMLTADDARRLYLKRQPEIAPGVTADFRALPAASPSSYVFYRGILGMSESRLLAHWSKEVFTGQARPPEEFASEEELKHWVATTPNGLGYIDVMNVDDQVKVLLTVAQER